MKKYLKGLFAKDSPSPSYPVLPALNLEGESNIKGLYMAGEIAGKPLIKIALNEGYNIASVLFDKLKSGSNKNGDYDVVVIGAGISGIAAAVRLNELGAKVVALDSGKCFQTLGNFTRGKLILAEPAEIKLKGSIPFKEGNVEETLANFDKALITNGVEYREYTKVSDIQKKNGLFTVATDRGEIRAELVLLSTGKAGNPRKAGVPGELEWANKIFHFLKDPDEYENLNLLIYGGGDVAAEAALALCDTNNVTLAAVDKEFIFPKKKEH